MKHHPWFALSIALNAVLGGILLWPSTPRAIPESLSGSAPKVLVASDRSAAFLDASSSVKAPEWRQWIEPLQAAGVPSRVLAGLVSADFEWRWEQRLLELQRQRERGEIEPQILAQAHGEYDRTREDELRLALGDAGFRQWDKENLLRDCSVGGVHLSSAESDSLYDLRRQLALRRRALEQANQRGEMDDEDLTVQLSVVETEYHGKLKPLLGEERYASLHAPNDSVDADLRQRLRSIKVDAAQFHALADLTRARDELQAELTQQEEASRSTASTADARRLAIDAALDHAYQRVLGASAFAEFQRENDSRYQLMQRYAPAWNMSSSEIAVIYTSLQSCEKNARDLRQQARAEEQKGRPVDWNAVEQKVAELSQQNETSLREFLGPTRFEKLKRSAALSLDL